MPKRTDLKKIMVIGSGPIVIGQGAEFDYAGTQACLALKEEGYEVILVNSNPATIMTDTNIADKVYMEPLDLEHIAKILRYERPDGLLCSIGGQTGLNLGMQLATESIPENLLNLLYAFSAERTATSLSAKIALALSASSSNREISVKTALASSSA